MEGRVTMARETTSASGAAGKATAGNASAGKASERRRRAGPSITELITVQWQRERSDLDLDNFLLAIYLMRLGTWLERAFDKMCQELWGIGGGDMRVMLALRRGGTPYVKRPTDLFRALLVTSGAITKKVDRLEAAGYVERLPDPGHNGGFLVHLTKKGLHAVDEATVKLANESVLGPATKLLTKSEREALSRQVLRILSTLEQEDSGHVRKV
jgi:DNA-binding MarR family transcriptional regulator